LHGNKSKGENKVNINNNELMPYSLWLRNIKGITVAEKKKLLSLFGNSKAIYDVNPAKLPGNNILSEEKVDILLKSRKKELLIDPFNEMISKKISYFEYTDSRYPSALREINDCPLGLFHYGKPIPNDNICAAIVGSRRCTAYGAKAAEEISYVLGKAGFTIVSGMARGIDSHAHIGALRSGAFTVSVLGCGVDVCYPPENQKLYHDISENGCIISEYPIGQTPLPKLFPPRNRIISGMSRHVIVAEARVKSGSLITADLALQYNRNVYAVPGRMYDSLSEGTNLLISNGASMITAPEDILKLISQNNYQNFEIINNINKDNSCTLSDDELLAIKSIDYYAMHRDDIEKALGISGDRLTDVLDSLSAKGKIDEIYSGYYVRK
jgi:DNA processing protein